MPVTCDGYLRHDSGGEIPCGRPTSDEPINGATSIAGGLAKINYDISFPSSKIRPLRGAILIAPRNPGNSADPMDLFGHTFLELPILNLMIVFAAVGAITQ